MTKKSNIIDDFWEIKLNDYTDDGECDLVYSKNGVSVLSIDIEALVYFEKIFTLEEAKKMFNEKTFKRYLKSLETLTNKFVKKEIGNENFNVDIELNTQFGFTKKFKQTEDE